MVCENGGWKPITPTASVRTPPSREQTLRVIKGPKPHPEQPERFHPYPLYSPSRKEQPGQNVRAGGAGGSGGLVTPLQGMSVRDVSPASPSYSPTFQPSPFYNEHAQDMDMFRQDLQSLMTARPTHPVTGAAVDPEPFFRSQLQETQQKILACQMAILAHGVASLDHVDKHGWRTPLPLPYESMPVQEMYHSVLGAMSVYQEFYQAHQRYRGVLMLLKKKEITLDAYLKIHEDIEAKLASLSVRNFPNLLDYRVESVNDAYMTCAKDSVAFLAGMCSREMTILMKYRSSEFNVGPDKYYVDFNGYHMNLGMCRHFHDSLRNPVTKENPYVHWHYCRLACHYNFFRLRLSFLEGRLLQTLMGRD